jgi:hypothetical protein
MVMVIALVLALGVAGFFTWNASLTRRLRRWRP